MKNSIMLGWLLHDIVVHLSRRTDPPLEGDVEHYYGMHPALYALTFGILSGTSLPIAAWMGIQFSPVSDRTCALMMAFGAGALLFAVTVELYGHALHKVAVGKQGLVEMFATIICALLGAAFYLTINKWLEDYLVHDHKKGADGQDEEGGEQESLMAALHAQSVAKKIEQEEEEKTKKVLGKDDGKKRSGKDLWKKAKAVTHVSRSLSVMNEKQLAGIRGREKAMRALHDPEEIHKAKSVAFALFLGLLVDGVPEGILMGFLAAEGHLTAVLIISLFIANFPEAFSSASLLIQAQMSTSRIIGMWSALCLLVGSLGGLSCYLLLLWFPGYPSVELPMSVKIGISAIEGLTGGAMLACISAVMLPEAFERAGKMGEFYTQSGFLCACGFLCSVTMKALFG